MKFRNGIWCCLFHCFNYWIPKPAGGKLGPTYCLKCERYVSEMKFRNDAFLLKIIVLMVLAIIILNEVGI